MSHDIINTIDLFHPDASTKIYDTQADGADCHVKCGTFTSQTHWRSRNCGNV